jgi:hypothetical protein
VQREGVGAKPVRIHIVGERVAELGPGHTDHRARALVLLAAFEIPWQWSWYLLVVVLWACFLARDGPLRCFTACFPLPANDHHLDPLLSPAADRAPGLIEQARFTRRSYLGDSSITQWRLRKDSPRCIAR